MELSFDPMKMFGIPKESFSEDQGKMTAGELAHISAINKLVEIKKNKVTEKIEKSLFDNLAPKILLTFIPQYFFNRAKAWRERQKRCRIK